MDSQLETMSSFIQRVTMIPLPASHREVTLIQDNAASLPNCMSRTMRSYLLRTFPDLATVPEEARWKSQPSSSARFSNSLSPIRNILPMVPQRQDSFSLSSVSTCSSASSASTLGSNSSASKPAQPIINRRQFLVRQSSSFSSSQASLLVRQSSLRQFGQGGSSSSVGLPRMPQRQDSVSFLF